MKPLLHFVTVIILGGLISSCTPGNDTAFPASTPETPPPAGQASVKDADSEKNILNIAAASQDHSTLAAAVGAAGLQNVLTNAGPLTVFVPTNAAFDKLPAGTVDNLLKPENKATLAKIITFHAAPETMAPTTSTA